MKKSSLPILPRLEKWKAGLEDGREKRRDELIEALTVECGYVSRAAERLQLSRQRVTVLVNELGLDELVRSLRAKRG